jgi:cohesin complex subunit SCC1
LFILINLLTDFENMFYSEQLLRKDGPLAYVWLAANMERKLSRSQFLKTDITDSVEAIVDSSGAPLALRLSGQLLLGVVRIYNRKTVYLMEDCNEALLKLKMAFRVGGIRNNVDIERHGAAGVTVARPQTLTLQNRVTELDLLLMPEPYLDLGPGFPMLHKPGLEPSSQNVSSLREITLPELEETVDIGRGAGRALDLEAMGEGEEELDLGLDFAMIGEEEALAEREVEVGAGGIEIGLEEELGLPSSPRAEEAVLFPPSPATPTHGADILGEHVSVVEHEENHGAPELSIIGEGAEKEGMGPPPLPSRRARAVRRAQMDEVTELYTSNTLVRENRKTIIRERGLLPADPTSFALASLAMDPNRFVDAAYRPLRLHADLSRLVNPEYVSQMMKRKRAITELEGAAAEGAEPTKSPRLELPGVEEEYQFTENLEIEPSGLLFEESREEAAAGPAFEEGFEELHLPHGVEEGAELAEAEEKEDAMLAATKGTGISRQTLKAASLLRETLHAPADTAIFETLLGPAPTKPAKVKMFFEMLVLATKDAISLRQDEAFGPIEVSAKQHLFDETWDFPTTTA